MRRGRRATPAALLGIAAVLAVVLLGGCGTGAVGGDYGGEHPDYAKTLADAPPPLRKLYAQSNELLPGGLDAYQARLDALRGYPVVVNVWASWCGFCRYEFPTLQRLSAEYGDRVAFFGVDSSDSNDAASTFLGEAPVPYPSYTDPSKDIYEAVGAIGMPATAFYDRDGKLVYVRQGGYGKEADFRADLERYALDEAPENAPATPR
jgi:cytochrome c biogenesis protein CcmG, thiol:disulfide interchange protein DsbE